MTTESASTLVCLHEPGDHRAALAHDVREGLTVERKSLPAKWLYDARGSALFEQITHTPEYYLTRTEAGILEAIADDLVTEVRPADLVEIGSGSSRKTRLLLEAMHRHRTGARYVPFDVSEDAVADAAATLAADYPWLVVHGIVGDFDRHLDAVPRSSRRLVACLGSTIGNFAPRGQVDFLAALAGLLDDGDALLVGADLVKDATVLEAAYDDAAGVTAAFTLNLLRVLQRELDAEVDTEAFRHVARWRAERACIEIGLQATRDTHLRFPTLDLDVTVAAGEEIRTELSCKYTRDSLSDRLAHAGLALHRFHTDPDEDFAVALAYRSGAARRSGEVR